MNKTYLLTILLAFVFISNLNAQVPDRAEDISPLLTGETVPDQELVDTEGKTVSLYSLLQAKPTVLIVYRGGWCPYCNEHLSELARREAEIINLGYQILAVSPDAVTGLSETGAKEEIKYQLLSDASGTFARALGIAFKAPGRYEKRLFEVSNGQNSGFLPVPSLFVLDKEGNILFEYISPNYRQRMSGDLLMAVLGVLQEED